jgi:hypothetical protein
MSFWEQFADEVVDEKGVASVLRRDSFTLQQVLSEDDVLQECAMSAALLEYLARRDTLLELVGLVAQPAPVGAATERRFRDPFLACELLRFGHASILDAFFSDNGALLDRLVQGFRGEPEALDTLVAEYVARVLLKLLEARKGPTLQYLRPALFERLVVHLRNTSVLNVLVGVFQACTVEVEVTALAIGSELGNARLKRVLDAESVTWLVECNLPRLLVLHVDSASPSAANALEALERLMRLAPPNSALPKLICSDPVSLAHLQRCMAGKPSIECARLAELMIQAATASASVDSVRGGLMEAVHSYCKFASAQTADSKSSLGATRLACGSLWLSVIEHSVAQDCPFLPQLVDWFFSFPNANLFHTCVVHIARLALERGGPVLSTLLTDAVMGRFVAYFQLHGSDWPRSPCLGQVIQALHQLHVAATMCGGGVGRDSIWSRV